MQLIISSLLILLIGFQLEAQTLTTPELQQIDSLLTEQFEDNLPGGAFSIIKDGSVVYKETRGLANMEFEIPLDESSVFNIASNSKQFTTLLALLLEADGKLSFTDDIRKHLPELNGLDQKITVKQLTNHTHGLPNVDELAELLGYDRMIHDQVVEMLLQLEEFSFLPGSDYDYNNTGYVLLSEIIERVGGEPFEQQLENRIFQPIGMSRSNASGNYREVIQGKAYSYSSASAGFENNPVKISTMGSSGIYASLNDLTSWALNYQREDNPFSNFFTRMTEPTILNSGQVIEYGMGLQFESYKGIDIVFHGGGTEGYRSYILHVPDHNLSLVFLSNQGGFSGLDVIYGTLEILLGDELEEGSEEFDKSQLTDFDGTYELNPGVYYEISEANDSLYIQSFGASGKSYLPQIAENEFLLPDLPYAKLVFSENSFDLRFADFTYPAPRVTPPAAIPAGFDLSTYEGTYRNEAYDALLEIVVTDNELVIIHQNVNVETQAYSETAFFSTNNPFGKIEFVRDASGEIVGLTHSRSRVKNLTFKKD